MGWIPENQRDSSYYIFNEKYLCKVKYIDTRSADHIKMFGMNTSGVREIDKEAANELITTYLTISQMAEYFKRGSNVRVVKIQDTKRIYERITDHLNSWKHNLEYGLNNRDAPIEDLLLLDKLACAVYTHAQHFFTEKVIDSLLLRQISGIAPMTRESLINNFNKNKDKVTEERKEGFANPEVEIKARPTMDEFFATHRRSDVFKTDKWS